MNFDSLYGHTMSVLGQTAVVLGITGYSLRDLPRKIRARRAASAEVTAVEPPKPAQSGFLAPNAPNPYQSPAPRWVLKPGYKYTGGEVSTDAVMDVNWFPSWAFSQPSAEHPWLATPPAWCIAEGSAATA